MSIEVRKVLLRNEIEKLPVKQKEARLLLIDDQINAVALLALSYLEIPSLGNLNPLKEKAISILSSLEIKLGPNDIVDNKLEQEIICRNLPFIFGNQNHILKLPVIRKIKLLEFANGKDVDIYNLIASCFSKEDINLYFEVKKADKKIDEVIVPDMHYRFRLKFAQLYVEYDISKFVNVIDKFNLYGDDLIKLAKKCAEIGGWRIAHYLPKFGISLNNPTLHERRVITEFARLCIKQRLSDPFVSMQIVKKVVIEILKIAIVNNCWHISEHISYCGLNRYDDKATLIDLAKQGAKINGWAIAENINKFGLNPSIEKEKEELIAILTLCAMQSGYGTAERIQNFGLNPNVAAEKAVLREHLLICASENPYGVVHFIQNFGLNPFDQVDKKLLYEVAISCSMKNGLAMAQFVQNFRLNPQNIEDKKKLFIIAKFSSKNNGLGCARFIRNFGFNPQDQIDKKLLINILMDCVKYYGGSIEYIDNFDLVWECDKAIIMKAILIASYSDGEAVAECIKRFPFDPDDQEDRQFLISVASYAALQNGRAVKKHLKNFGFMDDLEEVSRILKLCEAQMEGSGCNKKTEARSQELEDKRKGHCPLPRFLPASGY